MTIVPSRVFSPKKDSITLSVLVVVHNEERQLAECLSRLRFADEIVVLLDQCNDHSQAIACTFTDRLVEGVWPLEGERRNAGISACRGRWIFEIDADERVDHCLAQEIRTVIASTNHDIHHIPVDHYIGKRLVRHGWGAYLGRMSYPGLFRKGAKVWGQQCVHPKVILNGSRGKNLCYRLNHYIDRDISDMLHRLDRYSCLRAYDLRQKNSNEKFSTNLRRFFSRFLKCYVLRRGYREGKYGFLLALFAGLYPLLSYLKGTLEEE